MAIGAQVCTESQYGGTSAKARLTKTFGRTVTGMKVTVEADGTTESQLFEVN